MGLDIALETGPVRSRAGKGCLRCWLCSVSSFVEAAQVCNGVSVVDELHADFFYQSHIKGKASHKIISDGTLFSTSVTVLSSS